MTAESVKKEGLSFIKTMGAIASALGVAWVVLEPMVEDYIQEHIKLIHEEDVKRIDAIELTLDEDYDTSVKKRNEIVQEILYIYPESRLRLE